MDLIIDEKVTIWRRCRTSVEADNIEEAIRKYRDENYEEYSVDYLYETEEPMSIDDNSGESTIEIFDNNNKLIYHNGA